MKICIVDYGMGNITSVTNAIRFLNKDVDIILSPAEILSYDIIVLPGVGAFPKAMEILRSRELDKAIIEAASKGKRIVGICLGMQLLFSHSYEFEKSSGLNLIQGSVLPFQPEIDLRIPHMGWNDIISEQEEFNNFDGDYYFVHSFYCKPVSEEHILFRTNYGIDFCSGINIKNQIIGLQFHPEKSQRNGIKLLEKVLK